MDFIIKSIRRFPYLFLTFFFALGVVAEYNLQLGDINYIGVAVTLIAALSAFFVYIKKWRKWYSSFSPFSFSSSISLLFTFFFLGGVCEHCCHPIPSDELDSCGATEMTARVAVIRSVPKLTKNRKISCEADVYCVDARDSICHPVYTVLTFDTCDASLKKGDFIVFSSALKSTESSETIGFNYDTYLRKKGVVATSLVKRFRVLNSDSSTKSCDFSLETSASNLTLALQNSLRGRASLCADERDLIIAITLGNKTEMDDGLKEAYSKAGASHLLAVSGLHVGIIILIVECLVGMAIHPKKRPYIFAAVLLAIIWGYAFLTGLAASVVRTSLMYTVYRVAMLLFSKPNPINVVSFTAFAMLVYNPFNIFDLGFQLSFSAVYSILLFGQPLIDKIERLMPEIKLKGRVGQIVSKIRTYTLGSVAISISAQILTTPIILFTFHTLPILSIASSLFTIPLVTMLIPLTFIYYGFFLLSTVLPLLDVVADGVLYITATVAKSVNVIVYYTAGISFCTVDRLPFYGYDVAAYIIVFLLIAAYHNYRRLSLLWISASISVAYFVFSTVDGMNMKGRRMMAVYNVNGVTAVNRMMESNTLFGCNDTLKVARKAGEFWTNNLMASPSHTEKTYFEFEKHRVYMLSDKTEIKKDVNPLEVDILILTNNVVTKMSDLKNFRYKTLIVDGSNKYYVAKKWKEEREKSGADCHIVRFDGSWVKQNSEE